MFKRRPEDVLPTSNQQDHRSMVDIEDIGEINEDMIKLKERISKCRRSHRNFKVEMTKQRDFLKRLEDKINLLDDFITNL